MSTHSYTHRYTCTYTHTHLNTHKYAYVHAHMNKQIYACAYTYMHVAVGWTLGWGFLGYTLYLCIKLHLDLSFPNMGKGLHYKIPSPYHFTSSTALSFLSVSVPFLLL